MTRVAVLGASGYIGAAVVERLASCPVQVRAVTRNQVPHSIVDRAGTQWLRADLSVPRELARAVKGADAVIHLAARTDQPSLSRLEETSHQVQEIYPNLVAELVELLGRSNGWPPLLVLAGSTTQAGVAGGAILDGSEADAPVTAYDRQKLAAEHVVKAATEAGLVRGVGLRLPTVVGRSPGAAGNGRGVLAAMVARALADEPLTVWADGDLRRDFIDVSDVAAALVAAVEYPDVLAGRHWVIGSGYGVALRSAGELVATTVAELTGRPPVAVLSTSTPPAAAATNLWPDLRSDPLGAVVDAADFRDATGWSPSMLLRESVRRMVAGSKQQASDLPGVPRPNRPEGILSSQRAV